MQNETNRPDYFNCDGPTDDERRVAAQRWRTRRGFSAPDSARASGGNLFYGTPRKGKNKKFKVNGVSVR